MTTRQRAQLFHELAKLLGAGIPVDRSVQLLLDQDPAAKVQTWLKGMQRGLAGHLSVADTLARMPDSTPLEKSLIAAGERGGRLEVACEHLARFYDLRQRSQDKAVGAIIYPLILLHLGLVLPEVARLVAGLEGGNMALQLVMRLLTAWTLLGAVIAVAWIGMRLAVTSVPVDRLINGIPLVGGVRRHWALARFCQVFETGLLAAFRMSDTLRLAGDASQSASLAEGARQAARSIENGDRLAGAMKGAGVFPRVFLQSVATAEEAGTLDREMARWAGAEAELATQAQDRAAEWLPRIFYVAVAIYIVSRIFGMVSGYYGEMEKLMDAM